MLHAQLGRAEVALLLVDGVHDGLQRGGEVAHHGRYVEAHLHAGIFHERLLVDVNLLPGLHQHGVGPHVVHILAAVAGIVGVDGLVEVGQVLGRHLLAVVVEQHGKHLLVGGLVPVLAVVFKLNVLFLLALLRALHLHAVVHAYGPGRQLARAVESLAEERARLHQVEAPVVDALELVEVELALEVAR